MTLGNYTEPGLIIPHLRGREATSVIQELSQVMQREGQVPDLLPFYHAALNREFLADTDVKVAIAFPHVRLPGLKKLSFALGRSDEPLPWGARSARSVHLVFLLAVPATDSVRYLLFISALMRLSKNREQMDRLQSAPDTFEILKVLQQLGLRDGSTRSLPTRVIERE